MAVLAIQALPKYKEGATVNHQRLSRPVVLPVGRIEKPKLALPKSPASVRLHPFPRRILLLATLTILVLLSACQSDPGPQTLPAPTVTAETVEIEPLPQATVEATAEATAEAMLFEGELTIEVSAEDENAVAAALGYSIEELKQAMRRYGFSRDLTLMLSLDSEGRAMLAPVDPEAVRGLWIKDSHPSEEAQETTYEVTGDGILFLPIKGGTVLMTEASKEGSTVAWGISTEWGVRGGTEIIAYKIEETDEERVYVITHRVDSAGNWVKISIPKRLPETQTIFAIPEEVVEYESNMKALEAMMDVPLYEDENIRIIPTKSWREMDLPGAIELRDEAAKERFNAFIAAVEANVVDGLVVNTETGELETSTRNVEQLTVLVDVRDEEIGDITSGSRVRLPNGERLPTMFVLSSSSAGWGEVTRFHSIYRGEDGELIYYWSFPVKAARAPLEFGMDLGIGTEVLAYKLVVSIPCVLAQGATNIDSHRLAQIGRLSANRTIGYENPMIKSWSDLLLGDNNETPLVFKQ